MCRCNLLFRELIIYDDDFELLGSQNVIGHVTVLFAIGHLLLVVLRNQASISNGFRDILPQTSCAHRRMLNRNCACSIFTWSYTWCGQISRDVYPICTYFNFSPQFAYSICHFLWAPMKN